ncbi:ATP-binding cassette domain-containing protein [Shewanella sp. 10N.286.45.A1]|uniref:ATP-binding cassette domain-containing protein n=1 Tax=Shewanella sp. 10N.286.45.A1 TaxID=3229694 RepID=UPI0035512986
MWLNLRLIYGYLVNLWKQAPRLLLIAFGLLLLSSITEGIGILMLIPIINVMSDQAGSLPSWLANIKGIESLPLLWVLVVFLLLLLSRAVLIFFRERVMNRIRLQTTDALRSQLFKSFLYADWTSRLSSAKHQELEQLTNGVNRVGMTTFYILKLAIVITMFSAYVVVSVLVAPMALILTSVVGILLLFIFRRVFTLATQFGKGLTNNNQQLYQRVLFFLNGMKSVKAGAYEVEQLQTFEDSQYDLRNNQQTYHKATTLRVLGVQSVSAFLICTLVYLGLHFWQFGITELAVFVVIFSRMMPMFNEMQSNVQQLLHMLPAYNDIKLTIDSNLQSSEQGANAEVVFPKRSLTLDTVSFSYPQRSVTLDKLSVTFPLNQITLVSGPSGKGKTTVIDILASILVPSGGSLLLDGKPLRLAQRRTWRQQISYLSQESFLFNGSVRDNLLFGESATDSEIWRVLNLCQADFVAELPRQLDSAIGEGGGQLSGGQRQRLVLARALLRKRSLLILDEAMNALDADNERKILRVLQQLRPEMTIVMVSHSEQALDFADCVVRLP